MKRFMIAGTNSGCGKTTITCAVLQALVNRGLRTVSFKCGPDYIDPMFHSRIIGTAAYNLDSFFCNDSTLRQLFAENSENADISVVEGVMGFYDGAGDRGSSRSVSDILNIPVVIVIDCKGMSSSIGAVMKGFLEYKNNLIAGFIFNRLPENLTGLARQLCDELNTEFLGYFPLCPEAELKSRHLGLVAAEEVMGLKEKMQQLSEIAEKNIDIERLISLSENVSCPDHTPLSIPKIGGAENVTIAAARDKAFSFIYEDNINLLKKLGCRIRYFSPLEDRKLPENAGGIIISGGYPELYAEQLSENVSMLRDIREKISGGMPVIAECGGFMYLHSSLEDDSGTEHTMAGIIPGKAYKTNRLQRFGYINMFAERDGLLCRTGEKITAHEFHRWDSTACGEDFRAVKASSGKEWKCGYSGKNIYAGFPHIYFYSAPETAANFVKRCVEYINEKTE